MAVSIPDTLTVNTSERYILSIRIHPDGFSFSAAIPSKSNSFFYHEIEFDPSKTYAESLKETFFSEECLSWNYKKIHVFCFSPIYTCTPDIFFEAEKKEKILPYTFLSTPSKTLENVLPSKERLLFAIEKDVYEFLCRSFIKPEFIHHLTLPLRHWEKQSELALCGQMYVLINKGNVDIACFKQGRLLFLNNFHYSHPNDLLYYIACSWKQVGLDQLKDRLFLFGDTKYKQSIRPHLFQYIHFVSDMELPTDAYLRNPDIKQAPYEIILSVCE